MNVRSREPDVQRSRMRMNAIGTLYMLTIVGFMKDVLQR